MNNTEIFQNYLGVVEDINLEAEIMPDFGLFEASHIACPVLPQYHPKQLMELLNSGKIRWVKAILAHLVRCIGGVDRSRSRSGQGSFNEDGSKSPRGWSRSRTLSVQYQVKVWFFVALYAVMGKNKLTQRNVDNDFLH